MVAEAENRVTTKTPSHVVIREACEEVGVKSIAAQMSVSVGLIYKWCEPAPTFDNPRLSGALNPLDRVELLYDLTKDIRIVGHVCAAAGGFFCANPRPIAREAQSRNVLRDTQKIVREFSELLESMTEATENGICEQDARVIRECWEDVKQVGEAFAVACERGVYAASEA